MRHRTPKIGPESRALVRLSAPALPAVVGNASPRVPGDALSSALARPYDPTRHVVLGRAGSGKSHTGLGIYCTIAVLRFKAGVPFRPIIFDHLQKWRPAGFGKIDLSSGEFVPGAFVMNELELMVAMSAQRQLMERGELRPFPIVVGVVIRDWRGVDEAWHASLFTDEARLYAGANDPDKDVKAIRNVLCMGRHVKQDWCFMTQRPAHLHGDVFANASHGWIHPLGNHNDRAAVEKGLDISLAGAVWRPAPHEGAYYPLRWTLERGLISD